MGKKLRRARFLLARERSEVWSAGLDADSFVFRGLKLPEGEALDPGSIFEERITHLYVFQKVFLALFERFVRELADPGKAKELQKQVKNWTSERDGR